MLNCKIIPLLTKIFRVIEFCISLVLLYWIRCWFPIALQLSGEVFRYLAAIIASHFFVFLLSNAIIACVIMKSSIIFSDSPSRHIHRSNSPVRLLQKAVVCPLCEKTRSREDFGELVIYEDKEIISEGNTGNGAVMELYSLPDFDQDPVFFTPKATVACEPMDATNASLFEFKPRDPCSMEKEAIGAHSDVQFYSPSKLPRQEISEEKVSDADPTPLRCEGDDAADIDHDNERVYKRARSIAPKNGREADFKPDFRRSQTEKPLRVQMLQSNSEFVDQEETLSDEEFRRRIDEFLEKHFRFRVQESMI